MRSILAAAGASGTWDWDIVEDRLHVDARFAELYGLDPEQALAGVPTESFFKAIHPADRARMRIAVAGILGGAEIFSKEFRVVAPDGATLWMHGRGQNHFDADDTPIGFTGLLVDVTERKRTEERLRVAQSAGGIGTFEYIDGFATATVSAEFCALLGLYPASVLPVRTINGVVDGGEPLVPQPSHGTIPETLDGEFCITRSDDGAQRWIARRGEILREGSGFRLIGVIYDVTAAKEQEARLRELNDTLEMRVEQEVAERREAEDALRQAQKMEAVGQLTGGIAHDFNNLLQGITGSLEIMEGRLAQGRTDDLPRWLTGAKTSASRAAALTHRLLAFSRRQPLDPRPVRANPLIASIEDMLRRTLGERIELELVLGGGLWLTRCDPNQLESAILNLAINARDAMPGGGKLVIETCNAHLDSHYAARERDVKPGQYVCICVTDTGSGMSRETIERAFEPFFTTKPLGQGTGLGLSMIYGFTRQSEGYTRIYSEVGRGTTVKLYLPRYRGEEDPEEPERILEELPKADAGEVVLVVEDEPVVRGLIVEVLSELGYRAIEANDGPKGVEILQSKRRIDLLITDIGLPGRNGREVAALGRAARPELKVLFMTGYAENAALASGFLEPGMAMITKPFAMEALAGRIRQIIEE